MAYDRIAELKHRVYRLELQCRAFSLEDVKLLLWELEGQECQNRLLKSRVRALEEKLRLRDNCARCPNIADEGACARPKGTGDPADFSWDCSDPLG